MSQSNGLVASASQNEAGGASVRNRSKFPLSYSFYNTERFAEYTPFFVEEGVSGDTLPLHSSHEVRTYTLKAPLMQSLLKKKDFFAVPMSAILPLNWEKFYTNPVIGEDVPDDVGCGVSGFWDKVYQLFVLSKNYLVNELSDDTNNTLLIAKHLFQFFIFFEQFYSTGSLMESLGISGHSFIGFRSPYDVGDEPPTEIVFDQLFDFAMAECLQDGLTFHIGDKYYIVASDDDVYATGSDFGTYFVNKREILEILRDNLADFSEITSYPTGYPTHLNEVYNQLSVLVVVSDVNGTDTPLNLSRLWAYQLVCAHFYSNDHVDFIYSAELFRQYISQLVLEVANDLGDGFYDDALFSVNGFEYQYDALSAHYCMFLFDIFLNRTVFDFTLSCFAYFTALLSYKHSLRYMDYFTGSRTRPLAIGDASVDVNDSKVDVLDLSRSRMMAKFLQAVNRSGRKFGAYMQELFGKVPAPDYHNPFYLAHTSDVVGSSENQNTGSDQRAQNAFTSNFVTNASRYVFEYKPDRDCIVLGITYYDIPRVYTKATERQNFFIDRFDMFNPYMQFIGDQSIYRAEIGVRPTLDAFGYQNRHMEYKQRYNQGAGAFANPSSGLMNWIFVGDILRRRADTTINSSFIRSMNSELDHFYTAETGYALGSYFHFIVRYDNRQDASRPMAYAPVIA